MTTTLPRLVEDANPHDLEYPDIPSIPEENEEDSTSSRGSPINFQEFSPDIDYPPVKPWKGILKKTTSATWNIDQQPTYKWILMMCILTITKISALSEGLVYRKRAIRNIFYLIRIKAPREVHWLPDSYYRPQAMCYYIYQPNCFHGKGNCFAFYK